MDNGIIIINARVFDGENFIKAGRVYVSNGIIRKVTVNSEKIPVGYKIYDIKNRILSPGFIDIHTHGAGGVDSMDVRSFNRARIMSKAYAKTGVTSFVLACFFEDNNNNKSTASYFTGKNPSYARFLGNYLEGPFINPVKRGMIPHAYMIDPGNDMKMTMSRILRKYRGLKLMTLAPELKNSGEALKMLLKKRVIPAFGHSTAGYDETKAALKSGIRHVTHLFNAMGGFHHRNPGPYPAIAENPEVTAEIIADGTHLHPAAIIAALKMLSVRRVIIITDSTAMLGAKDGKYRGSAGIFTVKKGAAYLENKILMGSCVTLINMVKNVKKWCGLNNEEALRMVTYNPAKLLGFPRVGRIVPGFFADFNVLDDKLKLYSVFIGGRLIPHV